MCITCTPYPFVASTYIFVLTPKTPMGEKKIIVEKYHKQFNLKAAGQNSEL